MAAPEFTLFVKPYLEGWDNGEEGGTPMTAEILNENYDAFLLALNEWATSVGLILDSTITDPNYVHTDNNYTTTEKDKLSGIEDNANNYILPKATSMILGGVKVDGITIVVNSEGVISSIGGGGGNVEPNPIPFFENGYSYNVEIELASNMIDALVTLEKFLDGISQSESEYTLSSGDTIQFQNLDVSYDGRYVDILSRIDSIMFNGTVYNTGELIIRQDLNNVQSESYTGIKEGIIQDVHNPLSLIKIDNEIFSIPGCKISENGITYDFSYTDANGGRLEATQYTNGTLTATGHISYAEISSGQPRTVDVGNLRITLDDQRYYKVISRIDNIKYNGQLYGINDELFSHLQWSGGDTSAEGLSETIVEEVKMVNGNPTGTATAVLTKIQIGDDIFSIPGGGGGGSSVSFAQILLTGTKIGTITIDGVPTDIYAPTPPTNTSDLNNDSNFVSDSNYVHTDNNYTTTEKNKLADLNQVEANPSSGTSAGDLTSIEIDGTKYNIPSGGGGGTTVVANPSGPATAGNLNKLQVGNDIYQIPSGGGSSSGLYAVEETLFNTETALSETSYQLNSSIDNYDFIRICLGMNSENANWIFAVDQLHDTSNECVFYVNAGYGTVVANSNGDELQFTGFSSFGSNRTLRGVYGLKLSEPTPIPSWTDVTGTLAAGETSITLSNPAITPDSSIEPFTDTYGVVPTNMEIVQSSSILDKEIVLARSAEYPSSGLGITIKDANGETISVTDVSENDAPDSSHQYIVDGYLSAYFNYGQFGWTITFLKDCEDNGVEKHENDTVNISYGSSLVTQDIEYFTLGYGVQMTFEARQAALGVKVRVS